MQPPTAAAIGANFATTIGTNAPMEKAMGALQLAYSKIGHQIQI